MKRVLCCLLVCFLIFITSACQPTEKESPSTVPQSFSVSESGAKEAKSILLKNYITGDEILLGDPAALEEIVRAAEVLNGSNPISSRGYYGGSYGLTFYDTAEPTANDQPYLVFSLFRANETDAYLVHGDYEVVDGHMYSAMYPAKMEDVKALEMILAKYFE